MASAPAQGAGSSRWSSNVTFYLSSVGAAVGLGSIWRFPYLAGAYGGSAFVFVFVLACAAVATPLLVAEYLIGRQARCSPPAAAGVLAQRAGRTRAWNAIGVLGTAASFLIMSYYTVIAGWVMAYAWRCLRGDLAGVPQGGVAAQFHAFTANGTEVAAWHLAFVALTAAISVQGVNRGLEIANKVRAPALLLLLTGLVVYALCTGDTARGLAFAFAPDFSKVTGEVVLYAVGQAFYATGVGMAMMLAYGAYAPAGTSLVRTALVTSGSIVGVSLLATLMIFPLVYRYGLNPAQGVDLVFVVLPSVFAEMPGGRIIGTLFFLLLILAALTPTLAGVEPVVAWLQQRGMKRRTAALSAAAAIWISGIGSVLSFGRWAHVYPLSAIPRFKTATVFDISDFIASNLMLPIGALLTSLLLGWLIPAEASEAALPEETRRTRRLWRVLLRYVCPLAITGVLFVALRSP